MKPFGAMVFCCLASGVCAHASLAEVAPFPFTVTPYAELSDPQGMSGADVPVVFETIKRPGARWLRLKFSSYDFGSSKLAIRSKADGAEQIFTMELLKAWDGETAAFNGDAVDLILTFAGPEELRMYDALKAGKSLRGVYYTIDKVFEGQAPSGTEEVPPGFEGENLGSDGGAEALCDVDDRVSWTDARVGRIMPIGCTGWIIENERYLTAGHCVGNNMQTLQFNVPPSKPDGTPVMPPPADQYPIRAKSIVFNYDAPFVGRDWAVFAVGPSTATGRTPLADGRASATRR